ncbi:MAG: hypothetical protein ABR958_04090 [Dehalococcoidales bacterium]
MKTLNHSKQRAFIYISLMTLFSVGLFYITGCGPSKEELQQQKLEADRQIEREQVIAWHSQIAQVIQNIGPLMTWWGTIQEDFNRQLSEGRKIDNVASSQREDQLITMRRNLGQLYAVVNSTKCPNSCQDADQTLLQYFDKYQSAFTSLIAYNSLNNENDRLSANTKLNEADALLTQFMRQYKKIEADWGIH